MAATSAGADPPVSVSSMEAVVWSDYLCPWCYLGRGQTARIERLGVAVTPRAFELHPEIPPEGRSIRPDGRLTPTFDRIEAECQAVGMPFRRPTRMPNTRRALETAEVVAARWPAVFPALDDALFRAQFVNGSPLDDPTVLDDLVAAAGAPVDQVHGEVLAGTGQRAVDRSMAQAREAGVTATPTWLVDGRFLIPGAQPPETVERWVTRLIARNDDTR